MTFTIYSRFYFKANENSIEVVYVTEIFYFLVVITKVERIKIKIEKVNHSKIEVVIVLEVLFSGCKSLKINITFIEKRFKKYIFHFFTVT